MNKTEVIECLSEVRLCIQAEDHLTGMIVDSFGAGKELKLDSLDALETARIATQKEAYRLIDTMIENLSSEVTEK